MVSWFQFNILNMSIWGILKTRDFLPESEEFKIQHLFRSKRSDRTFQRLAWMRLDQGNFFVGLKIIWEEEFLFPRARIPKRTRWVRAARRTGSVTELPSKEGKFRIWKLTPNEAFPFGRRADNPLQRNVIHERCPINVHIPSTVPGQDPISFQ